MGVQIVVLRDGTLVAGNCVIPAAVVPAVEAFFRERFRTAQGEPSDERIDAWEQIAKHPVLQPCYAGERPLITSMLARLDDLADLEDTVNELAPAPAQDCREALPASDAAVQAAADAIARARGYVSGACIEEHYRDARVALRAAAAAEGGERDGNA